jgi:hypothetical protein
MKRKGNTKWKGKEKGDKTEKLQTFSGGKPAHNKEVIFIINKIYLFLSNAILEDLYSSKGYGEPEGV